jgi:teichoic acid transport system permease protein
MCFYLLILCSEYSTKAVFTALVLTVAATLGLTIYSFTTTHDFTFCSGILFAFITVLIFSFPFFLWLIAGMVPWFYMGDMITGGTSCIRKYSYLVNKMKYPVSTIPTFVSLSNFFINVILIGIVIVIFWIFGYPPDIYLLQLPFYMLLSFIFFTLWALFASFIGAMSKDFVNLVRSFITAVFWLSGILWDADAITIPWLRRFLMLNPVTFLVTGFRNCFTNKVWFFEQPKRLVYFIILTAILLVLGIWAYRKLRKEISDVL